MSCSELFTGLFSTGKDVQKTLGIFTRDRGKLGKIHRQSARTLQHQHGNAWLATPESSSLVP